MKFIKYLALGAFLLSGLAYADESSNEKSINPKVIFFDVNETLLDLTAMRKSVGDALKGREDLLPLWFSTMLHYSLVDSATERYHGFGDIGAAALMSVAKNNGIDISYEDAKKSIITPLRNLPPHPDVVDGLKDLKEKGYILVSLTNSSNKGVLTQFKNAGLLELFDRRLSVEDIQVYKPHLQTYNWAAEQMNVELSEALMVAAHGWDIAGAKASGMPAVFIARPGKSLYSLGIKPDKVVKDLHGLVKWLENNK